jgi:hypothetical protein
MDDAATYDTEKALSLVASHFRLPLEAVAGLARQVEFAADLHKTAVPVDARNANRQGHIEKVKGQLREWDRLFKAEYPDLMEDVHQMVERERRRANAVWAVKAGIAPPDHSPPDHVFIRALASVYREASGKELPAPVIGRTGRTRGKVEPTEFSNFVLDVFRALCDGKPPSLDTIRRVSDKLRMRQQLRMAARA